MILRETLVDKVVVNLKNTQSYPESWLSHLRECDYSSGLVLSLGDIYRI